MSKKQEAAPVAPSYQESSQEAIQAQLAALPQQKRIEAEAALGLGEFAGIGDVDRAKQLQEFQLASAPQYAQALLDIQNLYGKQFAQSSRDQLQVTDPTGFALRDQLGGRLADGQNSIEGLLNSINASTAVPSFESYSGNGPELARLSAAPDLGTVGDARFQDTGRTAAGRGDLEGQIFDNLSQAGTLDPALRRAAEQAARARGSASGNILGDSSALQEALAVQLAQQGQDSQRRSDALNFLSSGQGVSDTANRLAQAQQEADLASTGFNNATAQQGFANQATINGQNNAAASQSFANAMNAINQRNQVAQNSFSAQQASQQQRLGARQQDLANIQSFLGLQPIVSQGGQLSGLQQGAAPFQVTNVQQGLGVDPNAGQNGANFASNIFGTQSANFKASQSQGSPLGSIVGGLAGSFLGPVGTAAGSALGGAIFGGKK